MRDAKLETSDTLRDLADHMLACQPYRQVVNDDIIREITALAATDGDSKARGSYILGWAQGIKRDGAYPEELALYRDTSRRYLDDMFAQGELDAIGLYALAYNRGVVFKRDPGLEAAYLQFYAELDHGPNRAIMRMSLTKLDPQLDADARARQAAMLERLRREFVCRNCDAASAPPKG